MSFWEKVNRSLGVPCTEQRHREVPPLTFREDERGAVRGHENVTF